MDPSQWNNLNPNGTHALLWGSSLLGLLLLLVVVTADRGFQKAPEKPSEPPSPERSADLKTEDDSEKEEIALIDPFTSLNLEAQAVFVWDINRQEVLYEKNAEKPRVLASLTKTMSALVAKEAAPGNAEITIGAKALELDGRQYVRENERWTLKKLLPLALVSSSNHAAAALAAAAGGGLDNEADFEEATNNFVRRMNRKAQDLNLEDTYFYNPHGLDRNDQEGGAYGSARDVAKLMEHIFLRQPTILDRTNRSAITLHSLNGYTHHLENTNPATGLIPGLLASKTGYTDLSGGNLAVIFDTGLNRPVVAVVLGSSLNGRFSDMVKLSRAAVEKLATENTGGQIKEASAVPSEPKNP